MDLPHHRRISHISGGVNLRVVRALWTVPNSCANITVSRSWIEWGANTLGYRISSAHSHNSGQSTYALCRHRVAKSIVIFPELTVHFKHFLSDEARLVIMLQHRKQLVKGNNRNTIYLPEFLPWTASRLSYSSWHAHIPPLQPTFPSQRGLRYLAQAFLQHKWHRLLTQCTRVFVAIQQTATRGTSIT